MKRDTIGKVLRNTAIIGSLSMGMLFMTTQTAFAKGSDGTPSSGSADNGGNGEGRLEVFTNKSASNQTEGLGWTGTYYIELQNPGGKKKLQNIVKVAPKVQFNFFTPAKNFQGNPGKWPLSNPEFHVEGTLVSTSGSKKHGPYIYKVTLPSQGSYNNGNYQIETGEARMHKNDGEDEMYFSTDPKIGGQAVTINNLPSGQLPEVPYAGVLPALVLVGGGYLYLRRRRKSTN